MGIIFLRAFCGLDVRDIFVLITLEKTVSGYTELNFSQISVYFCLMNTDVNMITCNLMCRKIREYVRDKINGSILKIYNLYDIKIPQVRIHRYRRLAYRLVI